jgi:hypothetical protein
MYVVCSLLLLFITYSSVTLHPEKSGYMDISVPLLVTAAATVALASGLIM